MTVDFDLLRARAAAFSARSKIHSHVHSALMSSKAMPISSAHALTEPRAMSSMSGLWWQDCEDSLDHYLICDPLWTIVISCCHQRSELLRSDPRTRLGLCASWFMVAAVGCSLLMLPCHQVGAQKWNCSFYCERTPLAGSESPFWICQGVFKRDGVPLSSLRSIQLPCENK